MKDNVFEVRFNYVRGADGMEIESDMADDSMTVAAADGQRAIAKVRDVVLSSPPATQGRKAERVTGIAVVAVKYVARLDA